MSKKVLNKGHRELLCNHAFKLVCDTQERTELDAAYNAAADMVVALVEKKYPKADMAVLKKYGVGRVDRCIFVSPGYGAMEKFEFRINDERVPRVPDRYCNNRTPHLMDEKQAELFDKWQTASNNHRLAIDSRQRDFYALIQNARTFEDVEEIWPAAGALREKICGKNTAISTINDEVIARIKADAASTTEGK